MISSRTSQFYEFWKPYFEIYFVLSIEKIYRPVKLVTKKGGAVVLILK